MTDLQLKTLAAIRDLILERHCKYIKSNIVIGKVARANGMVDESLENSLWDETWGSNVMIELYGLLIGLVHEKNLVVGQGNFGDGDTGPAHPKFTECLITQAGLEILDQTKTM